MVLSKESGTHIPVLCGEAEEGTVQSGSLKRKCGINSYACLRSRDRHFPSVLPHRSTLGCARSLWPVLPIFEVGNQ